MERSSNWSLCVCVYVTFWIIQPIMTVPLSQALQTKLVFVSPHFHTLKKFLSTYMYLVMCVWLSDKFYGIDYACWPSNFRITSIRIRIIVNYPWDVCTAAFKIMSILMLSESSATNGIFFLCKCVIYHFRILDSRFWKKYFQIKFIQLVIHKCLIKVYLIEWCFFLFLYFWNYNIYNILWNYNKNAFYLYNIKTWFTAHFKVLNTYTSYSIINIIVAIF